jgi:isopenicillin N synthase-like dioxygenase
MVAPAPSLDYNEIPVLDWRLSETDKPTFLRQLRDAMINIGFLYLGNHTVPKEVIDEVKRVAPTIFSLPQDIKDSIDMSNSPHFHGYLLWDGSVVADSKDAREQFNFGGDRVCKWKPGEPDHLRLQGSAQVHLLRSRNSALLTSFYV